MGRRDYSAFAYRNSQSVTVKCNKHVTGNMNCKNLFKKIWLLNYQPKMTREGSKLLKPFHSSSTVTVIYFTGNKKSASIVLYFVLNIAILSTYIS